MVTMSLVFFGLMLIPLIIFLVWIIRKDKHKSYLGLIILAIMTVITAYIIVNFDKKFMEARSDVPAKSHSPSYR